MNDKFKKIIDDADRILITSHVSPDPDAIASILLLGTTLQLNFPDKKVQMASEEEPKGLNFLNGYNQVKFMPVAETVGEFKPDLFIMVDANNFERCSRKGGQKIKDYVTKNSVKTAIIDHHQPDDKDETDYYLNSSAPSSVQEVYALCFEKLKLKKPEGYAQTTMLGLYSDTGGFIYSNPGYQQTFELVSELVAAGADIEATKNRLNQYSEDQMRVIGELAVNTTHENDFTYAFISDEFAEKWQEYDKPIAALHMACKQFIDSYIRNIDGRAWGFLVYPDPLEGKDYYSVSLRSAGEAMDVSEIARKLNGGGHKPAAGAKVQANNVEEAVNKVKEAINQNTRTLTI